MALIPFYEWLPEGTAPAQLFVLLHGEQSDPQAMAGLAAALRVAFPDSVVLAPASGQVGETVNAGYQWYGCGELSDAQRAEQVDAALPELLSYVRQAQQRFGLTPAQTALVGFSQGATMGLALATHAAVAGRVLAFSGRFATLPTELPGACTFHFLHGQNDPVTPVAHAQAAHVRLGTLNGDSTIDIASQVGHALHPALVARAIVRLQTCVPLHSWKEALGVIETVPQGVTLH
ncbi:MAG: esterase [Comamonadaceae bacterium]|nr:MAG: esterase [Comamonadaceae bacterium]